MLKHFYRIGLGLLMPALLGLGPARAQTVYSSISLFRDGKYPFAATEPLSVVLPTPIPEPLLSKKIRKPEKRAAYLAEIAAQRTALEMAAKQWRLSPVTVISEEQGQQLTRDKAQEHLLLMMGEAPLSNVNQSVTFMPALVLFAAGGKSPIGMPTHSDALCGQIYWPFDDRPWQAIYPASALVPVVQQLQEYVKLRAQKQSQHDIEKAAKAALGSSADLLKGRTLLLSRPQLTAGLPESALASAFPFPVQLTDQATLDAAVAANDARYVYVHYVTMRKDNGYQLLDAATGKVLGWSKVHSGRDEDLGRVTAADLKQMAATATGK